MQTINHHHRRGITLMFVMSMIVLFLLLATTFVIVSNNFFVASKKRANKDVYTTDGTAYVERAFYDIIRGPELTNTTSPLRTQDLLSDMYGYGFTGFVNGVPVDGIIPASRDTVAAPSNGQLIEFELRSELGTLGTPDFVTNIVNGLVEPLSETPGFYNGHVLTFVSGKATGISTRIVDYQIEWTAGSPPTIDARKFTVMVPGRSDRGPVTLADLEFSRVVVNGRAFAGTGTGAYDAANTGSSPALDANALEPNRVGESLELLIKSDAAPYGFLARYNGPSPGGNFYGPNESYDAVDVQNMFLSGFDLAGNVIPSFLRYSLVDHHGPPVTAERRHLFSAFNSTTLDVDNDNDGIPDSIWIDPGYPVQTNGDGRFYKALVAYYIVDLDGRLNINLVGNLSDMTNGSAFYSGDGYGPAGVSLFSAPNPMGELPGYSPFLTPLEYDRILRGNPFTGEPGRYGFNGVPGAPGRDEWSIKKLFGYPVGTNTVGKFFQSSPIDIRGRFAIGTPTIPQFPDLNDPAFNNGLPIMDLSFSVAADDMFTNSPYESNFALSPYSRWELGDDDTLFTALELEALLRPFDADSSLLASRLKSMIPTASYDSVKRKSITTDSYEVPMAPYRNTYVQRGSTPGTPRLNGPVLGVLRQRIRSDGTSATNPFNMTPALTDYEIDWYVRELMSPELLAGLKMDVNRPFGNGYDDNFNEVIDDPLETALQLNLDQALTPAMDLDNDFQPGVDDELARMKFAKRLYVLMLLVCEDELDTTDMTLEQYRTAVAQWAINVVDFRDPDSINTPFEFDINPWNGWEGTSDPIDGDVSTDEGGDRRVVWGMERPELLFSESIVLHDRACEDSTTDNGDSDDVANGDTDFDSRLIPRTSAFIELYHPWTQNSGQQNLPPELARDPTNPAGVDLQRVTPSNGDPVWRIGVKRDNVMDTEFIRTIYFTTPTLDEAGDEFYTTHDLPVIPPGTFAVIGSSGTSTTDGGDGYRTTFGRLSMLTSPPPDEAGDLRLDDTRSITLVPTMDPTDDQIVRNEWDGSAMDETLTKGIAIVIDGPRSLSLSDPNGGYPVDGLVNPADDGDDVGDGYGYFVAHDIPLDNEYGHADDHDAIWANGTTDAFRTLSLQRLANPLLDYNVDTNPYITIDVTPVDLVAFNGTQEFATHKNPDEPGVVAGPTEFGSLERGENQPGARMLFAWDQGTPAAEMGAFVGADEHNFSYEFFETFGRTNFPYTSSAGMDAYSWLTWNNRPFVSQLELANVPFVSSEYLTRVFTLRDTAADPYEPMYVNSNISNLPPEVLTANPSLVLGSSFGHLLNFYGHDEDATALNDSRQGNFYRLFDFTEVPSRYVGTEFWPNPATFINNPANFFSSFRYPGKININTIPNEQVYNAWMGHYRSNLTFSAFNSSRWTDVGDIPSVDMPVGGLGSIPKFPRPYRNTGEGNLVPPRAAGTLVQDNVECGLYRSTPPGGVSPNRIPRFDFSSSQPANNTNRSAYFRNAMRQRLGNLTTTRSSVFAIWITVGYFEADRNGKVMQTTSNGGFEVGAESGEVVRNRGFYIFDRSIPVAFEPGKNHNVERGIIVQTIIE